MNAREEILGCLKQASHPAQEVRPWLSGNPSTSILEQFTKALEAAKGEVFSVKDLEDAWGVLRSLLLELGAKQVVFNQEPPLEKEILELKYPQGQWNKAGGEKQAFLHICLDADVGVTSAAFALAETGSIGIASGADHARVVSLIPPVHIVLLSEKVLVQDLISWEHIRPKSMPSQVVFISGPSKTADIEQTLVVGAHGPKRLIVIVYGDT